MFKPKASASRRNVPKPIKPRQIVQEHQATSATTEKKEKTLTLKQHQNIMANNVRNHKQAFEGLASACHHQIQQTKQEAIGSEKDVYLITVHR